VSPSSFGADHRSIPVVVAKCGLYLKQNSTEVEGTFRVSGSAKRTRELQAVFDEAPGVGPSPTDALTTVRERNQLGENDLYDS
jgi:hypothetical protein